MAAQLIRISNEVEVPYLTYSGQPVLTFTLIDKVHNRVEGTAGRNFRSNRNPLWLCPYFDLCGRKARRAHEWLLYLAAPRV